MNEALLAALGEVNDPELHKDLVTLGMVKKADLQQGKAEITNELTTPACPLKDRIRADIEEAVERHVPGTEVRIEWTAQVRSARHGGGVGALGLVAARWGRAAGRGPLPRGRGGHLQCDRRGLSRDQRTH